MDVGVGMHYGKWGGIGEDKYSVSLLLFSFAFPYSMVFGCIRKNLHCYIQLALDICYISGNSFLGFVVLLISPAYFLDVQIYNLYPFLDNNYNISHVSILFSPFSIIFLHLFLCSSLHIFPNLYLPIFSQCGYFSFFSFNWSAGSSFFCSLSGIGISSGKSISPSGDGFLDFFVFLSFIFAVSSFYVFSFSFSLP